MTIDFTAPCEHGIRWRQGGSCRACWEYAEGANAALKGVVAELERVANTHQNPKQTTWWAAAQHVKMFARVGEFPS